MQWTDEQKRVIETRDKNILVSAAAGSGKTAVLVERIMQIVMDRDNPVDIDKLLVVTFTRPAAAEMRERILKTFEKVVTDLEDDEVMREHLEKQCTYIHNAKISTIDSFCLDVLKENISLTDVDPGFRMAEPSEVILMTDDALKNVLDRHYEAADQEFMDFVEAYSDKAGDDTVEQLITKFYKYARSYPNPKKWIVDCGKIYSMKTVDEFVNSNMAEYIKQSIKESIKPSIELLKEAIQLCTEENGLEAYQIALFSDIEYWEMLEKQDDILELLRLVNEYKGKNFAKAGDADEAIKKKVSGKRGICKGKLKYFKDTYCSCGIEYMLAGLNQCKPAIDMLIKLTLEFYDELDKIKKEKNVMDFADVSLAALSILTREENGHYYQTEVAKEMAEDFVEVMIDEYQDSNYVQEVLLTSVSKCQMGHNNIFMVGDVKQSIYKFRLARPELFLDKYNSYPLTADSDEMKIMLSMNFRSRKEILDSSNLIFAQIMTAGLGGIEYDELNKLNFGANYKDNSQNNTTELILVDNSKEKIGNLGAYNLSGKEDIDEESDLEKIEAEGVVIANRIKELMNPEKPFMVKDKITEEMRPIRYKDIVILTRSKVGAMDIICDILNGKGIPASSSARGSMLDTFEINVILNFLRIIDNPRQDIPLVSVLKNVFAYTENDLALIRGINPATTYYDSFVSYEGQLKNKNEKVLELLKKYRHYATYMPIHKLVKLIISETMFEDFVSAMPTGELRMHNIDIFIEKAENYAKGAYTGLFNFIRYIEKIKNLDADKSEDTVASDEEDTVKLITIHKSKGLEYPVVFVTAIGKSFNLNDIKDKIVLHSGLGVGINRVDLDKRVKSSTVVRDMIKDKIIEESYAEEIRILYVALTRAKEKLILVGSGDVSKKLKKYMEFATRNDLLINKELLLQSDSFLDMILMSLVRHKSFDGIKRLMLKEDMSKTPVYDMPGEFLVTLLNMEDVVYNIVSDTYENAYRKDNLINWDTNKVYSDDIRAQINERFSYVYKYENDTRIRAKHSVSDIKHAKMEIDEFAENKLHTPEDDEEYVPVFMRDADCDKEDTNGGALRGSAVHRFFELFDYDAESFEVSNVEAMMEAIRMKGTMSNVELELVNPWIFKKFMETSLGKRMQNAHKNGELFRERPFVMGMKARDVDEAYDSDEIVVVQGIIDAFFYEDGEVVIVDYKTDSVDRIEELVGRYKAQLDCYADAIRKVTGKKVKEKLIYSTKFNDEIAV